jgi:ABC-2 type transport system ATP-binding protein
VAVIDRGRVVAVDSPSALTGRMGGEQVLRFRVAEPLDDRLLTRLPEVQDVRTKESGYVVTGTKQVAQSVLSTLTGAGIMALDLRLDRATLDDAFVALVREDETTTTNATNAHEEVHS